MPKTFFSVNLGKKVDFKVKDEKRFSKSNSCFNAMFSFHRCTLSISQCIAEIHSNQSFIQFSIVPMENISGQWNVGAKEGIQLVEFLQ